MDEKALPTSCLLPSQAPIANMSSHCATSSSQSGSQEEPFSGVVLSPHDPLYESVRTQCPGACNKQRRYYCSDCLIPLVDMPKVKLPLHVHILQSGSERPQQSTAQHIGLLARDDCTIWRPFPECNDRFQRTVLNGSPPNSFALLFPCEDAKTPEKAASELDLKALIVLDATWTKSAVMLEQAPFLADLPKVTLPASSKPSAFWRYAPTRGENSKYFAPDKVRSLVSTVEAVHRFCSAYDGAAACDDLLWLFAFNHSVVKKVYEEKPGKRERIMRKSKGLLSHI